MLISNLNLESPLESAGEESSERAHDGGETGQSDAVDLERVKLHCGLEQTENTVLHHFCIGMINIMKMIKFSVPWWEREEIFTRYGSFKNK